MALFRRRSRSKNAGKALQENALAETPSNDAKNTVELRAPDSSKIALSGPSSKLSSEQSSPVTLTLEDDAVRVENPHITEATSSENGPHGTLTSDKILQTSYTGKRAGNLKDTPNFQAPEFNALLPSGIESIDVTPREEDVLDASFQPDSKTKSSRKRPQLLSDIETENLIKANEEMQSKLSEQNDKIKSLRDDILHVTRQLDDAHKVMSSTRESLSTSEVKLEQRNSDLKDALLSVSSLTEKSQTQSRLVEANAAQIKTLRAKLSAAGKTLSSLKGQQDALKRAEKTNETMIRELTLIQVEISEYKRKVDDKIKSYRDKLSRQDIQIAALKTKTQEKDKMPPHDTDVTKLIEARNALEAENSNLKIQLIKAEEAAEAHALRFTEAEKKAAHEKALSADDLARIQETIAQQAQSINDLKSQLAAAQAVAPVTVQEPIPQQIERFEAVKDSLESSRAKQVSQPPAAVPDIQPAKAAPTAPAQEAPLDVSFEDFIMNMKLGDKSTAG